MTLNNVQPNPKQPLQIGVLCPGIGGAYWSGIVVYFGAEYPNLSFIKLTRHVSV